MRYVIGVDGGNTKTIALVAGMDGTIMGSGRGGCSDIYGAASPEAAIQEVELAVSVALDQAAVRRDEIASAYFCLAGADWPEDFTFLEAALRRLELGGKLTVANDALGALRAGSPDGTGVVITCGTGIATAARNAEGQFWHSSFWPEPLCGVELGRRALRAVYRAELAIDPPTALTEPILRHFQQPTVEALLHFFWSRGSTPPTNVEVSRLAPIVLQAAEEGDPAAERIVHDHGLRLAEYAIAAARKVRLAGPTFPLVLNGGIFRHQGQKLVQAIIEKLSTAYPGVVPVRSRFEPAVGALMLALESVGVIITNDILENVQQSLPSRELFLT